jgi:hypothetical protein
VRGRPRHPHRLTGRVPAGELDRPRRFGADDGGGERTLAPLLRADQLPAADVDPRALFVERVEVTEEPQLFVGQPERLAAVLAVRDDAEGLNPRRDLVAEGRKLAGI